MSCTVTETIRTAFLKQVETGELDPESPSYPYPRLRLGAEVSEVTIPILVIENDLIRAEIAPSLGGRILVAERKDAQNVSPLTLELEERGPRGVTSPFGVQVGLDGWERLDALAPVDVTTRVSEEGDAAEVLIASAGWPLSVQARYEILDGCTEIGIDVKVVNRSLQPAYYCGALIAQDSSNNEVYGRLWEGALISSFDFFGFGTARSYVSEIIWPHQTDAWHATLDLIEPDQDPKLSGNGISVKRMAEGFRLRSSRPIDGAKITVFRRKERLEAKFSIKPGQTLDIPISQPEEVAIQVFDPKGRTLFQEIRPDINLDDEGEKNLPWVLTVDADPEDIHAAAFGMDQRYFCHLLLGYQALKRADWQEADYQFEQSLLYNGEDHLAWWFKAYAARMLDPEAETRDELLNAHYLAPLEPALKAEAFLSQPITEGKGKETNPLLGSFLDQPDHVMDVTGHLLEAGLYQDASRFISEILRSADFPMYRYALAFCYLKGSRMAVEAAAQLQAANRTSFTAPFPFRAIEIEMMKQLHTQWPNDALLTQYWELAVRHEGYLERRYLTDQP